MTEWDDKLILSILEDDIKGFKEAIKNGGGMNDNYHSALRMSIINNDHDMVSIVLSYGADVHSQNNGAFKKCFSDHNIRLLNILLEKANESNESNFELLRIANLYNSPDSIEAMIDHIIKLNGEIDQNHITQIKNILQDEHPIALKKALLKSNYQREAIKEISQDLML